MKYFFYGMGIMMLLAVSMESFAGARALHIVQQSSYSINAIPYKVQWIPTAVGSAANSAKYVTRAVAWTPSVVGALTKPFLLSPGGLALTAALIGAGYVIDEFGGLSTSELGGTTTLASGWNCYKNGTGKVGIAATPEPCAQYVRAALSNPPNNSSGYSTWDPFTVRPNGDSYQVIADTYYNGNLYESDSILGSAASFGEEQTYNNPVIGGETLTEQQVGDLIAGDPYSQYLPDILTDPVTGEVVDSVPLQDMLTDVASDMDAQYDNDPATVPDTDPATNDDALDTETEEITDCDFFPTLCKWLDWFKQGEDLTLDQTPPENLNQEIDISTYAEFDGAPLSIGGSGTCPTPYQIVALTHNIELNYTPFCTLAGWLNPLLLAIATMIGIFYFVRIVSN